MPSAGLLALRDCNTSMRPNRGLISLLETQKYAVAILVTFVRFLATTDNTDLNPPLYSLYFPLSPVLSIKDTYLYPHITITFFPTFLLFFCVKHFFHTSYKRKKFGFRLYSTTTLKK